MIHDNTPIGRDERIEFVGFNIEDGKIIAEKIYYRREKHEAPIAGNKFIQDLLSSGKRLRFFSEENANRDSGIVKYDFQVESFFDWIAVRRFFKRNVSFYDEGLVTQIEHISWLQLMFTTVGVRFVNDSIKDVELYYRCKQKKSPRLCKSFRKLLHPASLEEYESLMRLMFAHESWVRLVALDFQQEHCYFKVYFETAHPELGNIVQQLFRYTNNWEAVSQVLKFARSSSILFTGIAIVIDTNTGRIRYNFYFTQE